MAADRRRDDRHRRTGQMQFFNSRPSLALAQSGMLAQRAGSLAQKLSISPFCLYRFIDLRKMAGVLDDLDPDRTNLR
jgi:hypothetical protein